MNPPDGAVTRVPLTICPACGYRMDAAGTVDGRPGTPQPGDATGCIACGQPLIFEAGQRLRAMTELEFADCDLATRRDLERVARFAREIYQPLQRAERN